eukprot:GDKI01010117.1.p1 GENE.GDKI01010117.1~~GDKI01010117.1.p1  ORF type:complete len:308 (+),score=95.44 GDKI01010117.1:102-1025(+)
MLRSVFHRTLQQRVAGVTPAVGSGVLQQVRHFGGGDEKIVKARMKSVRSIQKITKAMKMVAASKLKSDQRRLEAGKPFAAPVMDLFSRLSVPHDSKEALTLITLSSDRGLCGGVNTAAAKLARATIVDAESLGASVKFFGVGDKIRAAMQRLFGDRFLRTLGEVTKEPFNFVQASCIAQRIVLENPLRTLMIHNVFKSAIAYDTVKVNLITKHEAGKTALKELDSFAFEPERRAIWDDLHEFYYASSLYACMLDNVASEQSARMSAMDNASKNAGEMLGALTLKYNKARQARITMELIEIISGANAL